MTNKEYFFTLSPEKQEQFQKTYANHKLTEYIDWSAFMESEDGNELHFLKVMDKYTDEKGRECLVLKRYDRNGMDYQTIYIPEIDEILEVADTTYA